MSNFFTGLLSLFMATNAPQSASNVVQQFTNASGAPVVNLNDPVEQELQRILEEDDKAATEIDKWIRDAQAFESKGAALPETTLNPRINARLNEVKKAYDDFLTRNPKHARARIAYGSFLNDTKDEAGAAAQWEMARELDPKNPAVWNNLANYYGHRSPVKKSFEYYAKAIELNPNEPVYYQNFATTVYLFRKDAMEFYGINENQVFDKALDLYRQAIKLAPTDFLLYSDYAQSFYGTKPPRWEEGLKAWQEALLIARDELERDGVRIHIARCAINLGQKEEARKQLNLVTNEMYVELRDKLRTRVDRVVGDSNTPESSKQPASK